MCPVVRTRVAAMAKNCDIETLWKSLAKAEVPSCGIDDMVGSTLMSRTGK
jgi:hypothetical protein